MVSSCSGAAISQPDRGSFRRGGRLTIDQDRDPARITGYHAHVYYDAATKGRAAQLREALAAHFPDARLGRWHDGAVGPHPQGMYQVAFATVRLAAILPWLMLNRAGLTVLVHPETGDDYADHAEHALWLGGMLPLDLESLRRPS